MQLSPLLLGMIVLEVPKFLFLQTTVEATNSIFNIHTLVETQLLD